MHGSRVKPGMTEREMACCQRAEYLPVNARLLRFSLLCNRAPFYYSSLICHPPLFTIRLRLSSASVCHPGLDPGSMFSSKRSHQTRVHGLRVRPAMTGVVECAEPLHADSCLLHRSLLCHSALFVTQPHLSSRPCLTLASVTIRSLLSSRA